MVAVARDMKRKPTGVKPQPPTNMKGIGKARTVQHKIVIGKTHVVTQYERWSRTELAYSAGSSAELTMPMWQVPYLDLFAIMQDAEDSIVSLEISTSVDGKPFKNEFSGIIDSVDADFNNGTYTVAARSFAQILLNAKVTTSIVNKTTKQAVLALVAEYGMGMKVNIDNFNTPVGKIFKEQQVQITTNMRVWDLIESFAIKDGADLYVIGDTLYYKERAADRRVADVLALGDQQASYTYEWKKNIKNLSITHAPLFAHDIQVEVKSYSARTGTTFTGTATAQKAKVAAIARALEVDNTRAAYLASREQTNPKKRKPTVKAVSAKSMAEVNMRREQFTFVVPNLSQDDCARLADQIMKDISRHEFVVNMTVLAQPGFSPRHFIKLLGTGSDRTNQVYAVKSLTTVSEPGTDGSGGAGYVTSFVLVNHSVKTLGQNLGT